MAGLETLYDKPILGHVCHHKNSLKQMKHEKSRY